MNKIYDKLLLALAVLALLAGVGFYVMKSGALPSAQPQVGQPADHPYQAIPVPQSSEVAATWPEATEQAPGELYDVFTPPEIYIDNDGTFIFKPPYDDTKPKPPFGVYLAEIKRDAYRIQLEGYIEEDLSDASKSLLLLSNEETGTQVRARIGQEKAAAEFKLLDFTIERLRDEDDNPYKIVKATLLDQRTGEEVVLTHGERLFNDSFTITVRSEQDASVNIDLKEAPSEFETPAGKYVLQEINLEASTIKVEKLATDELAAETRTLNVRNTIEEDIPTVEAPEADESSQLFDFAF